MIHSRFDSATQWIRAAAQALPNPPDPTISSYQIKSSHRDIVSRFDQSIEAFLSARILAQYPEDGIVGEELAHAQAGSWVWYVDPIDGTANFLNQKKNYAISIGCYHDGVPEFGLVLDVAADRLFSAQRGKGAFRNGSRLVCANMRRISESFLSTPMIQPVFLEPHPRHPGMLRLARDVRAVRSLGSVALELCALADGQADLFVAAQSSPWDHNAARLILSEAGGALRTWSGGAVPPGRSCAIAGASSPALLKQVMDGYFMPEEV